MANRHFPDHSPTVALTLFPHLADVSVLLPSMVRCNSHLAFDDTLSPFCLYQPGAKFFEGVSQESLTRAVSEDVARFSCPDRGLGCGVVVVDVLVNRRNQILDTSAIANCLKDALGDFFRRSVFRQIVPVVEGVDFKMQIV